MFQTLISEAHFDLNAITVVEISRENVKSTENNVEFHEKQCLKHFSF